MPTSSWGPSTWKLFHTLAEKIKEEDANKSLFIKTLLSEIKSLCLNLPCPYCSKHSGVYFQKNIKIMKNVSNKEELIKFLFDFHNSVNKSLRKKEFPYKDLEIYKIANTTLVFNEFYNRWTASTSGMMNHIKRSRLSIFHNWLLSNRNKFNV